MHGRGIMILLNGEKKEGIFEHGKRIKWVEENGSLQEGTEVK